MVMEEYREVLRQEGQSIPSEYTTARYRYEGEEVMRL